MTDDYSEKYIREILQEVKTIAVVGASGNNTSCLLYTSDAADE